ncbi:MAG: FimV family protein, partial [Rubrivivax sp.]
MKNRTTNAARFALTGVALAAGCLWGAQAWALGLGRLSVQSSLGEALWAEIDVTSITPEELSTLRLRVAPAEAYRAAGVEFNPVLSTAQVTLQRRADGRQVIRLSSDRAVLEPFVDVILEANWSTGRLVREYTMLF